MPFKDVGLRQQQDEFYTFRSARGYMTTPVLTFMFGKSVHLTSSLCEPFLAIKI
jgi:hypothetical protein